jgi:hypothetical protein
MHMRALVLFSVVLLLAGAYGCQNNDDDPPPSNSQFFADSTEDAGILLVQVSRWNGASLQNIANAYVSVHNTFEDANSDGRLPLFFGYTASDGFVDFSYVNRGNYYLYTEVVEPNGALRAQVDIVQVQSGRAEPSVKQVIHNF